MTYDPNDPRLGQNDPTRVDPPSRYGTWLPILVAAAIAAVVLAMVSPRVTIERAGDTTIAGPSVETVATKPSQSTSPAVSTPTPTTEQPNAPPAK